MQVLYALKMDFASTILLFIAIVFLTGTVTECQKSQYLVLSELRKTGMEGTLLQVNCTAHIMSPMDSLKWIPGHEGQTDIQQAYLTNTTVVMTISSLDGSDAGRYKCLLVMADGREETAEFELMVRRKEPSTATCSITQFKCKKTKHCIFLRYRCDGKDDCGDGSDEDCESNPCLNKFRCNNSRCVDNQDVCNHVDNCGDLSDEAPSCILDKSMSTTQPAAEDSQFGWLKITMSTVIASTVGVVILISFIIIVVFRIKMKRLRERRTARAHGTMYRHGESREATSSGHGDETSDQRPFLPPGSHHYGNIIVNVNNGVQYLPGYDYSLFVAVPPPYSECGTGAGDNGGLKPQPPPYSTIDRNNKQHQACLSGHTNNQTTRQNISVSSVQNCLGALRGPNHAGPPGPGSNENVGFTPNGSSLCRGQTPTQEFEGLSGITSTFLQSLLGSHCEGIAAVDGARSGYQHSTNGRFAGTTCDSTPLQKERNATDYSIEDFKSVINKRRPQQTQDTVPNNTQTTSQSLTFDHANLAASNKERNQNTNLTDKNCDKDSPAFTVAHHCVTVEHQNPDNENTLVVSASDQGVTSNWVSFNDRANATAAAVTTFDEHCKIPSNSQSTAACEKAALEDGIHLLEGRQVECNLNGADSNTLSDIVHPLLSSESDAATCHTVVNEMPHYSEVTKPRPVQPVDNDENLTLKASNSSEDCGDGCTGQKFGGSQFVKKKPDSDTASSRHITSGDVFAGNGLSFQSSIENLSNSPADFAVDIPSIAESTGGKKNRFSGELNIKDGCVVLESPKHTPSSQILSHLQGAYAAEQLANTSSLDEPVGNTKRPAGVVARPSLPKFQSDFVLRYRNQPL